MLDGSHAVPQLNASGASTATTSVTIPAGTASGAYYLLAVADAAGVVAENSESNNTESRSIQIGTDLVVSSFTVPTKGGAGMPLAITETTRNQGTASASASTTRYFLSTNSLLDANDTALTPDHAVPQLQAGLSHSASLSITIPANTTAGSYYLIAKADATGVVTETNETNNTMAKSIPIGGDLTVSTFTAPSKGGAGTSISVSDTTINQGAGPVASSATRFYLSANSVLDSGDTLLSASHSVPSLDAGISHTASTTVTIPANQATGSYYLIAKADGDSQVPESQESNNTGLRTFQIGPDLAVPNLSGPSQATAGAPFVVTDTTTNQGGGAAGGSTVAFYLSTNWTFDASDTSLNVSRTLPALAAGGTSSAQTTLTIPAGTASGTYYIIAKADPQNALAETSESNNTDWFAITVTP
jgi:subtilase family serine protease